MQKRNRQMSYSLYISALAGSDTVVLFTGKCGKFTSRHPVTSHKLITDRIRSMGEGNVFTDACHSFHN